MPQLTERERKAVFMAAQGEPDYAISYELGLASPSVISRWFHRIAAKLNAASRTNAVVIAVLTIFTEEERARLGQPCPPSSMGLKILHLASCDHTIKEIARELECSTTTIDIEIMRVKAAFGVDSLADAIKAAASRNFLF